MAKNAKLTAAIKATRRTTNADRMADFKATSGALEAIFGNLGTTQKGLARKLTNVQDRQMAAVARLAAGSRAGREAAAGREQATNIAGAATGLVKPTLMQTSENVQAAGKMARGSEFAAGVMGAGGNKVMDIIAQGGANAQAGATAQLADALRYRAKNDAQAVMALQQMKLEAQLQFQTWKKQQDYLKRLEEKDATGESTGISQVGDLATDAGFRMRTFLVDNPDATVDELIEHATEGDSNVSDAEKVVLRQIALSTSRSVGEKGRTVGGYTTEDEADDILAAVLLMYPNYKGSTATLRATILEGLKAQYNAQAVGNTEDAAAGGGDMGTYQQAGNTVDRETGYVLPPKPPKGATGTKAAKDGSTIGSTKTGRAYRYIGGNPYYQDTGYVVPAQDLP